MRMIKIPVFILLLAVLLVTPVITGCSYLGVTVSGHEPEAPFYQYRRQADADWAVFTSELNRVTEPARVDIFIG